MAKECFYFHGDSDTGFAVIISSSEEGQALAEVLEIDAKLFVFDSVLEDNDFQNGTHLNLESVSMLGNELFQLDIWAKYYFPRFTNEEHQWYHKENEDDICYMEMLYKVMKYAYDKAIELTGLKTY